jgi:hypothetical protein
MTSLTDRKCLECSIPFKGRADKKFCCDLCRTAHHNRVQTDGSQVVKNVNNILRRNRKILTVLNPEGKRKVALDKLLEMGFNFNYFTSTYRTRRGVQYFYCYDQGYLPLTENNCLLLVRKSSNI